MHINNILRYVTIYLIIVISIFSFYFTTRSADIEELNRTKNELNAITYIQVLYHLGIDIIEFKNLKALGKEEYINILKDDINSDIDSILHVQEEYPIFKSDLFNIKLEAIRDVETEDKKLLDFLALINHENYHIGDVAGLLFESDRNIYFLGTLLTHYMPEYIISLYLSDSYIQELYHKGKLSQERKNLYLEENKLVDLSSKEVDEIIKRLTPTQDVEELSLIMKELLEKLNSASNEKDLIFTWKKENKKFLNYLERFKEIKILSRDLNDKFIEIITESLEKRQVFLENKMSKNNIIMLFLFILISVISFYFYQSRKSNILKEKEIEEINKELDAVVLFSKSDLEGNITHASSALLELNGYKKEELIGKNHRIFKAEGNDETLYEDLWKTISNKKVWKGELKNKRKDGTTYWTLLTASPELSDSGEILSYNAYRLDITNKKKLEDEKLNTQKALEFKSKFLSNMSHEMRTPLNAIIGLLGIAIKTDLNEKQGDLLKKVKSSSDMLLEIINDVLDISKIEAGKMNIEKSSFNLKNLLNTIENLMIVKATEKNISLSIEYDNIENYNFLGDSLRISQVLSNLVSNAIKFSDEGKINITIKMLQNLNVRFEVKDSGIGLKPEQIENLFEDFTQADMSTSRKYGGTGLGLSISKQLVVLMDGKIWVESEFGKGATFTFDIPLEVDINIMVDENEPGIHRDNLENQVNTIEAKRILIAEDNKMNQMVLSMLLEESKLELDFALDGQIALEKYKANTYDLIFMDIQMPNMNGYEATKSIRLLDKEIPIIALSANVLNKDIEEAKDVGMNEYLAKPIENKRLYKILIKYLS